jgi:AcrR family transcriptional regulator
MRKEGIRKIAAPETRPRVVKLAEIRRNELVDCAQALFFSKGYEATTIADILARAGVSKGGFYHHFQSKEELLDALIERMTETIIANARDILDDTKLDALAKLNRFLARSQQWKAETAPAMRQIYMVFADPANALLYLRITKAGLAVLGPALARIVEQGNREGTFTAPDPSLVAEMILHLANARQELSTEAIALATRGETDKATDMMVVRIRKEEALVDRVLGLPKGSVRFVDRANFRKIMAVLAPA